MVMAGLRSAGIGALILGSLAFRLDGAQLEYRLLATNRTSTMQSEMSEAGAEGFRFSQVMGGETAFGGKEAVVAMVREGAGYQKEYRLLATNRTSTMQSELDAAGRDGFEYVGQTVFETTFGGKEVVVILERGHDRGAVRYEYRLLATRRTSTLEREMREAGADGFILEGLTVGATRFGGREVLAILSRSSVARPE
jgi:hypothetical protein